MAAALGAFVPDTAVRWRGVVAGDVARRLGVAAEARALAGRLERAGATARDAEARAARGDEGAALARQCARRGVRGGRRRRPVQGRGAPPQGPAAAAAVPPPPGKNAGSPSPLRLVFHEL